MSIESFLNFAVSSSAKEFLLDKVPLFLIVFAFLFLLLMILFFSIIKVDNIALVAAPCFIIAVGLSWFVIRAFNPYLDVPSLLLASIIPLVGVAIVVIIVAQILRFLW